MLLYSCGEMVAVSSPAVRLEWVSLSIAMRVSTEGVGSEASVMVRESEDEGEPAREREAGTKPRLSLRESAKRVSLRSVGVTSRCRTCVDVTPRPRAAGVGGGGESEVDGGGGESEVDGGSWDRNVGEEK
ncbi:hypothetical protein E2C01_077659 [Portunus trituberculatus]|uniref:Uncharacterized protein n=1 Tax=Portunus trituberculatus TaxID=210409 RepID=A0A5B7IF10_PORTR|nr:hypothetical protein [Portunus trituberculatus]